MIDYDSFSRCHLTNIFFRYFRGSKRVENSPTCDVIAPPKTLPNDPSYTTDELGFQQPETLKALSCQLLHKPHHKY